MSKAVSKVKIFGELLSFFWQRKLWWLIPMIVVLVLVGLDKAVDSRRRLLHCSLYLHFILSVEPDFPLV